MSTSTPVSPYISIQQELNAKRAAEEAAERERMETHSVRVRDFKPPEVHEGMDVFWYQGANSRAVPSIAKVQTISADNRTLKLQIFGSGVIYETVRHLDDPALANINLRERGAWGYTDSYMVDQSWRKNLLLIIEGFQNEVKELRAELATLKSDKSAAKK